MSRNLPPTADGREGLSEREAARNAAHGRLMAAIATEADAGELVPCVAGLLWTSDHPQDQQAAAYRCRACHLIDECKRYVTAYPEPSGVWAGMSVKDRERINRKESK